MINKKNCNRSSYFSRKSLEKKRKNIAFCDFKKENFSNINLNINNELSICSLNLNRYPRCFNSGFYLISFILNFLPTILCLQEIENLSYLRKIIRFVNNLSYKFHYRIYSADDEYNNTRLCFVYDSCLIKNPIYSNPFKFYCRNETKPYHNPCKMVFDYFGIQYVIYNLHLPCKKRKNYDKIIYHFFSYFNSYLFFNYFTLPTIIAGDWNMFLDQIHKKFTFPYNFVDTYELPNSIDHIFVRFEGNFPINTYPINCYQLTQFVLDSKKLHNWKQNISDHFPILLNCVILETNL